MNVLPKVILSLSIVATNALFAADLSKTKEAIQNIEFVKKVGFSVKDVKELNDVYAVNASHPKTPKLTLFVSKDLKTVVIGQGFMSNGEPIDFPINMAQYQKEAAYTIGEGKNEYYLFTDPECPYCQTFEQKKNMLMDDIKIYVYLFPLDFHQNAQAMSRYILSRKNNSERDKAMNGIANGKEDYKSLKLSEKEEAKLKEQIARHMKLGQEIGVTGTPAVFDSKGKPIQWPNLLKKQ